MPHALAAPAGRSAPCAYRMAPATRRTLLAGLAAGGHLAATGFLVLAGPNLRNAAPDSTAMIVDLAQSPTPESPRRHTSIQSVVKREPAPTLAVARNQPPADAREAVPIQESPRPAPAQAAPASAPTAAAAGELAPALVPARFDADYLNNPEPPYPAFARRLGEQGRVLLAVSVSAHGLPENVEIKATSGSPRLDQAALEAVRRWRFVPAKRGDTPIQSWVTVPIVFSLEG